MEHQGRYIELLEVLGEVGLGEGLDALVGVLETGLHAPGPELVEQALRDLGAGPVGAVERTCKLPVELRAVLGEARTQAVEHLDRQPLGIGTGLQQERGHCGDQDGLGDSARSVAADVARDLPASGGVANQRDLVEIEGFDHCRKVVGIPVHVVAR